MSEQNWDLKRKEKSIRVSDKQWLKPLFSVSKETNNSVFKVPKYFTHIDDFGLYNVFLASVLPKAMTVEKQKRNKQTKKNSWL